MSDVAALRGLSLAPMRGLRYTAAEPAVLGALLCPPYDVIDDGSRAALLASDPDNAVRVVLPRPGGGSADSRPERDRDSATSGESDGGSDRADSDPYQQASAQLATWLRDGVVAVDETPALYIYEMRSPDPSTDDSADDSPNHAPNHAPEQVGRVAFVTRGLVGAVELRDPADGVILPHENTMAGPVADRLALMDATDANLEPIYLVYDGGGAASDLVASVDAVTEDASTEYRSRHRATEDSAGAPRFLASALTPDGVEHRLWAVTDQITLSAVAEDLAERRALIADGHHRYATYRRLAAQRTAERGAGPWSRGLALLVDSSAYGPQVHPIHRVVPGLTLADALAGAEGIFAVESVTTIDDALDRLEAPRSASAGSGFAVAVTDGTSIVVISSPDPQALAAARTPDEPEALLNLDISILHRLLIERSWRIADDEHHVYYAHDVDEALAKAKAEDGVAVLVRATPVEAVAKVAAAGARMPRKSTFFTPKPASGLVMRRFADQLGIEA